MDTDALFHRNLREYKDNEKITTVLDFRPALSRIGRNICNVSLI